MSVDVLISPRISFSHDVNVSEDDPPVPSETLPYSSSSIDVDVIDFAFSVDRQGSLIRESSTADQLFSHGKILTVSTDFAANNEIISTQNPGLLQIQSPDSRRKEEKKVIKSLKEHLEDSTDEEDVESENESTKPRETVSRTFWKFRRSSSLNLSNYMRNREKQSIPSKLKLLSRSKSTGLLRKTAEEEEATKPGLPTVMEDETTFWKLKRSNSLDCDKSSQNRACLIGSLKVILSRSNSTGEEQILAKSSTSAEESQQFRIRRSSSLNCDGFNRGNRGLIMGRSNSTGAVYNRKKEFLKQNSARSSSSSSSSGKKGQKQGRRSLKDYYANFYRGERVNPVLNLPSPYISRASVDLLGFGSLFCNGRRKKSK